MSMKWPSGLLPNIRMSRQLPHEPKPMAVDETLHNRKREPILEEARRRAIAEYRQPFLEALRRCSCHCHLKVACGCKKDCEHCRPNRGEHGVSRQQD